MTEDQAACGLGDRLAHAQQGGFFSWFCLAAVGADEPALGPAINPAHDWRRFRPSGPRFHHLAELAVGLDDSHCITGANLSIARSFIDRPPIRPFARDIAQSFLCWVLPAEAELALRKEIGMIGAFADGESVVIGHPDALRSRWLRRSRWLNRFMGPRGEADVFMGRRSRSKRRVGGTCIAFENRADPRAGVSSPAAERCGGWLFMRVSRE